MRSNTKQYEPINDPAAFGDLVDELASEDVIGIDTEFHRERTYFPKIALLQVAWQDKIALIDPLAVDLAPLAKVLDSPTQVIIHAASQDLEVLLRSCGVTPRNLFDTQIAAGFLGLATPSLGRLVEAEFGVRLPKDDRLTDWLARPLTEAQLRYAATDVAYLIELWRRETAELEARGRLGWVEAECVNLRDKTRISRVPEEAWRKIKEARHLKEPARSIVRSVAAWRERRAIALDQPARFIMSDIAVVAIAQKAPTKQSHLSAIRGLDDRHMQGECAVGITKAVIEGKEAPPIVPDPAGQHRELPKDLRPAVGLVSAWVSQLARDEQLDPALLATRNDLEAFLRGDEDARLAYGWRADLVGDPIRRLVTGQAALAFAGGGRLTLEERSHQPVHVAPTGSSLAGANTRLPDN